MLLTSTTSFSLFNPQKAVSVLKIKTNNFATILSTTTATKSTIVSSSSSTSIESPPTRTKSPATPPSGKFLRQDYLVKKFSAKEIQEVVRGERNVPLIIGFYATWCGPCILMAQELEMLAVEYESNAMIVKVDTDDEYGFARDMQVRGLPTLYFISPDPTKDAIRTEGVIPLQMMRDIIDNDM
ncbi:thioredoxin-like protein CITRX, chloroplastic [Rutidosis leptorrhynchoides]|uniref:thioredoxin-like protein CITRX, chloroplastic n=1 Tax=Rutidosis leptorrhynchoides TaxID=125765 RepID=UPI003A998ADD